MSLHHRERERAARRVGRVFPCCCCVMLSFAVVGLTKHPYKYAVCMKPENGWMKLPDRWGKNHKFSLSSLGDEKVHFSFTTWCWWHCQQLNVLASNWLLGTLSSWWRSDPSWSNDEDEKKLKKKYNCYWEILCWLSPIPMRYHFIRIYHVTDKQRSGCVDMKYLWHLKNMDLISSRKFHLKW